MEGNLSGNEKVLIVDDNRENLKLLKTYLSEAGYQVAIASGGQIAIERATRLKPSLILLDVNMPDMDGFTVCQKLKKNSVLEPIPVLFVTASHESDMIEKGFEVGGVDYITKPIRKSELLARVKNHLQIFKLNQYLENELDLRTKALKESENRYRLAIEGTQDGLWDLNLVTNVAFISNNYEKMLGYDPGELPRSGDAWSSLLHPDDIEPAMKSLRKYLSKETEYYESTFRMKAKDGTYRWVVGRGKAEYDDHGKPIRIIGFNTDITERKEMEIKLQQKNIEYQRTNKELQETKQRYDYATTVGKVGTWDWDIPSGDLVWSDEAYRLLGFQPGEIIPSYQLYLEMVHSDDREFLNESVQDAWYEKKPYNIDCRIIQKKGKEIICYVTGKVEFNKANEPIRMLGTIQDISERKQTERELIISKEKAEESDRLKTAFLNNLSHEIRTPMNGIIGFADLLRTKGLSKEKQRSFVDTIEKSGNRMLNLVNDLIDISRIESGEVSLTPVIFNLNQVIDDALLFFTPHTIEKGLKIDAKKGLSDKKSEIYADKTKVEQILSNLIINAIKFTPNGGIDFGYELKANKLRFWVKDTGIGIPEDKQDVVFERFMRIDSKYYQAEGSGLGLSICKAYVELFGGEIWMESKICEGSVFYFSVPYSQKEEKNVPAHSEIENGNINEKVFLIAEDDAINFLYLEEIFYEYDIRILHAKDGQEAIDFFNANKVDIALIDIKMPIINGYEVLSEIRKTNKTLPVIAQTAYASDEEERKCLEMGFDCFISKPYNSELIVNEVSRLL